MSHPVQEAAEAGADEVIAVCVSGRLSGTLSSAVIAAEEAPVTVHPVSAEELGALLQDALDDPFNADPQQITELSALLSEQAAALTNQFEQPAARAFIVAVDAQMVGELANAGGQKGNLNLGRTGITRLAFVLLDNFGFFGLV